MENFLKEHQVAEVLGVSRSSLQKWRCRGCGPPFCKLGAKCVRYPESGLHKWLEAGHGGRGRRAGDGAE